MSVHPPESERMPTGGRDRVVYFDGALYEEAALYKLLGVGHLSPSDSPKPTRTPEEEP